MFRGLYSICLGRNSWFLFDRIQYDPFIFIAFSDENLFPKFSNLKKEGFYDQKDRYVLFTSISLERLDFHELLFKSFYCTFYIQKIKHLKNFEVTNYVCLSNQTNCFSDKSNEVAADKLRQIFFWLHGEWPIFRVWQWADDKTVSHKNIVNISWPALERSLFNLKCTYMKKKIRPSTFRALNVSISIKWYGKFISICWVAIKLFASHKKIEALSIRSRMFWITATYITSVLKKLMNLTYVWKKNSFRT